MRGTMQQIQSISVRLLILIGFSSNWKCVFSRSVELPCNFFDSVNITDGQKLNNQSIIFDGIEYPKWQYAELDYIINNGIERISAHPHIRGCLCNRKPCLRLCCPLGTISISRNGRDECHPNDKAKELEGDVLDQNNQTNHVKFSQILSIVDHKPCNRVFSADGDYRITYNGLILYEDETYNHNNYCFKLEKDETTNTLQLILALCLLQLDDDGRRPLVVSICMILSVISMIATLLVYGCISKLRNLNGLCLMRYLSVLAVGFAFIAWIQINDWDTEHLLCPLIGYIVYFIFISAFSWLSVINFDMWLNSKSIVLKTVQSGQTQLNCFLKWLTNSFRNYTERKQLLWYMLYGYGIPCFMVSIIFTIDHIESIPDQCRPQIGKYSCLMDGFVPKFLFFYMPVGVILTLNVVLFVLTAINFHQVHQQAKRITSQEDGTKIRITLSQKKDVFKLYLRLSVVAGVTWIMEVISFLIPSEKKYFQISDTCNALQGVFIFILFVMRRRVFCLIRERWNEMWGKRTPNRTR